MKIDVIAAANMGALAEKLETRVPHFVSVHLNCELDQTALPNVAALHGATSCLGAMSHEGIHEGLAAFVIEDADGDYGTATLEYGDDPKAAAQSAVREALNRADRPGETPDLIWLSSTPGVEEQVIDGIQSIVGDDVPIIGGSAADNSVEGNWFVFNEETRTQNGLTISVLFPSKPISFAYQNGYSPTTNEGVVTAANGRTIQAIDNRPAMEVFAEWTGGAVKGADAGGDPKAILSDSTLWPLGREVTKLSGVPFYLLAHPAVAQAGGEIDLFATVEVGEKLTSMAGTIDSLTDRAGRVAELACKLTPSSDRPVAGALMIYCGGCMLSVREELDRVVTGVNAALGNAPFLGAFTFGEQGPLVGAGNRHGNLMISCVVFEGD
ncbi:MAG: FIST C-terminal domain-containing protein [Marinovum sp.]|nr:FIST C-terminal domain-containing protein [Marinovum sp.]